MTGQDSIYSAEPMQSTEGPKDLRAVINQRVLSLVRGWIEMIRYLELVNPKNQNACPAA